jgi:hypothetical protein
MIDLDGQIIHPDREVAAQLARLVTIDPDADIRRLIEETAGMADGHHWRAALEELLVLRREARRAR